MSFGAHPLAGTYHNDTLYLEIGDSGSLQTNVKTPAGFTQTFTSKLTWHSTSPTTGYYVAYGYFPIRYTWPYYPNFITCHHPVKIIAYHDQVSGSLNVNFLCPEEVYHVAERCVDTGVIENQIQFMKD